MEKIKTDVLKQMFLDGARLIIEKEPYLTEIDSVIGDGDHGEGMKRGCEALIKILETENYVYVDVLCRAVSITERRKLKVNENKIGRAHV